MSGKRQIYRALRRKWRDYGRLIRRCALAMALALLHLLLFSNVPGEKLEPLIADCWFKIRGAIEPPADVIMVTADPSSFQRMGVDMLRPWSRSWHARLIDRLQAAGARLVVFDMVFSAFNEADEGDQAFAAALRTMPTALGHYVNYDLHTDVAGKKAVGRIHVSANDRFSRAAGGLFLVNLLMDNGVVRRFKLAADGHGSVAPPLAGVLPMQKGQAIPGSRDFIGYYGPPGSIRKISYADVLEGDVQAAERNFAGKVAVVGLANGIDSPQNAKDIFMTPASASPMFGVEIHATIAGNLLQQDWIRRIDPLLESVMMNILVFLICILISGMTPAWGGLCSAAAALGWAGFSYAAFRCGWFVPGAILVVIILPLCFTLSTLLYYLMLSSMRRRMEAMFRFKLFPDP